MCWLSYPIKHPCALSQAMGYLQLKWKFLSRICIFAGLIKRWPQKAAAHNLSLLTVPKQTSFKGAYLTHKRRILGRKQERNSDTFLYLISVGHMLSTKLFTYATSCHLHITLWRSTAIVPTSQMKKLRHREEISSKAMPGSGFRVQTFKH